MSNPLKDRRGGSPGGSPTPKRTLPAEDDSSNDRDTIRGETDTGAVDTLFAGDEPSTPVALVPTRDGSAIDRYCQILQDRIDQQSDDGSIDDVPRRVGSPMGSVLSVPDDISVQVGAYSLL
ncbi:hypothetical protein jhhlp_005189 [Lomentospora prolificans]|uniref:Uncharacterized protein n=1 Tax=Lomentospora prolificans TaxID=41688 RepID=A0A2N3N738_9PEZI|nr:hypothetical protein jhhlp_005189 [Lomentospora prolificans]